MTDAGWELADPHGVRTRPDPEASVRLWHPIREAADDVRAWRDFLLERGVRQPYKQAFRGIYLLTPAEERAHSLRPLRRPHAALRTGKGAAQPARLHRPVDRPLGLRVREQPGPGGQRAVRLAGPLGHVRRGRS